MVRKNTTSRQTPRVKKSVKKPVRGGRVSQAGTLPLGGYSFVLLVDAKTHRSVYLGGSERPSTSLYSTYPVHVTALQETIAEDK